MPCTPPPIQALQDVLAHLQVTLRRDGQAECRTMRLALTPSPPRPAGTADTLPCPLLLPNDCIWPAWSSSWCCLLLSSSRIRPRFRCAHGELASCDASGCCGVSPSSPHACTLLQMLLSRPSLPAAALPQVPNSSRAVSVPRGQNDSYVSMCIAVKGEGQWRASRRPLCRCRLAG